MLFYCLILFMHLKKLQSMKLISKGNLPFFVYQPSFLTFQGNSRNFPLSFRKYRPITTYEQRCLYKTDFQAEYEVYKALKEKVDSVSTKFTELQTKREQFPTESSERKVCSFDIDILKPSLPSICMSKH